MKPIPVATFQESIELYELSSDMCESARFLKDGFTIGYHGTSPLSISRILKEGVLWGGDTYHKTNKLRGYRYTYLTPDFSYACNYGSLILEVAIDLNTVKNNYGFNPPPGKHCWQYSVFEAIPISNILRILPNPVI